MKPYRPRRASTTSSPPPLSAVRRLATEREPGTPIRLMCLFRAPPPVRLAAGKMWIGAPTRKVTVLGALGSIPTATRLMLAVRRKNAWFAYVDQCAVQAGAPSGIVTTGPLDPRERDIVWAWGWKSKAAKALMVMEVLR